MLRYNMFTIDKYYNNFQLAIKINQGYGIPMNLFGFFTLTLLAKIKLCFFVHGFDLVSLAILHILRT